jgi:hypothetical protein
MTKAAMTGGFTDGGQIGSCVIVFGTVRAVSSDGVMRAIHPNSPVFFGDRIMTGSDGIVSIVFQDADKTQLDLGRMSDMVVDSDVFEGNMPSSYADAAVEVAQIQQALLTGEVDATVELEAPGAGTGTGAGEYQDGGGGIQLVRFEYVGGVVTPQSGADTEDGSGGLLYDFIEIDPVVLSADSPPSMAAAVDVQQSASSSAARGTLVVDDVEAETAIASIAGPQDAILVDEAGNGLVADLNVDVSFSASGSIRLAPLDASGTAVVSGDPIFENGVPLLIGGQPVIWQQNDDGSWSAVVMRASGETTDDGHAGHDETQDTQVDHTSEDESLIIRLTSIDHDSEGQEVAGRVHSNGQGVGVGNPFINMDSLGENGTGSEILNFSFLDGNENPLDVTEITLNLDHLSGAHGTNAAEQAVWVAYGIGSQGQSIEVSGVMEGKGQGSSSTSDQKLTITADPGVSFYRLEMSFANPTGNGEDGEVCGQGYRISSIAVNYQSGDTSGSFEAMLKSSEEHTEEVEEDYADYGSSSDSSLESAVYEQVVLFTVYPEVDSSGTLTGSYIVDQENAFHDNTFSFQLITGHEHGGVSGGKQDEIRLSTDEAVVVVTGTDHPEGGQHSSESSSDGKVHSNGQGTGVGNPFINMDDEGSEVLHFNFMSPEGEVLNVKEVTLGIDHLSQATGGQAAEIAVWKAYIIDENGDLQLVGSGELVGIGHGSGENSDQLLNIALTAEDGSPVYFNALDVLYATEQSTESDELLTASGTQLETSSLEYDEPALPEDDRGLENGNGGKGEGSDADDEESCGQGFRVSSIEGVFDPGDHSFDFAAVITDDFGNVTTTTFDVTFDGDGYVTGGAESEVISGSEGDDYLVGGGGDDIIWGGAGNDVIIGGTGDDELAGGDGSDLIYGEEGGDIFVSGENENHEVKDYASGEDQLVDGDLLEHLVPVEVV